MKITILGTSGSTPTKHRNLSSILLNFDGENFLFDAPEGVQQQMMKTNSSYLKIQAIFLTHLHADHVLGFPGAIATMNIHQRDSPLIVFGPKGVKEFVKESLDLIGLRPVFQIKVIEVKEGIILEQEKFFVEAIKANHDIECFGYVFKEKDSLGKFLKQKALDLEIPEGPMFAKLQKGESIKFQGKTITSKQVMDESQKKIGKKISYVVDTLPDKHYFKAIKDSDILFHDSAFLDKDKLLAKQRMHSTAKQAGEIAEKTGCKQLYLIQLSARYSDNEKFENEARMVFANSITAKDLDKIEL
ncbi:MAG: ribonuclease Z [archaeon]|nr:ribonuclease Z [archaeon]